MTLLSTLARRKGGIAIGFSLSLMAGLAQFVGWLDPINNFGFDLRFRLQVGIPADPRIVLIDIDESSIRAVGEYPWPRRYYADLIRELGDMGAGRVVLDVFFADPARPRIEHAKISADNEIDPIAQIGDPQFDNPIFDDDELASALPHAPVYLPMVGRPMQSTTSGLPLHDSRPQEIQDFTSLDEFLDAKLPPEKRHIITPEREDLVRQFRSDLSRRLWTDRAIAVRESREYLVQVVDAELPLYKFVRNSAGIGFVAYQREKPDGILRAVPLAVHINDRVVLQLGLLAAIEFLGDVSFRCEAQRLHIRAGSEVRMIPIGDDGQSLIRWNVSRGTGERRDEFAHVPASRFIELAHNRRTAQENLDMLAIRRGELVQLRHAETPAEYRRYADNVRRLREFGEGPLCKSAANPCHPEMERSAIREDNQRMERDAMIWLERAHAAWSELEARDDAEIADRDRIAKLYGWFGQSSLQNEVEDANKVLNDRNAALAAELALLVGGKICMIGHTATGVADLVTTPVHPQVPGVMVHANVANMVLQNRFLRALSQPANAGLVTATALLAALIACAANWRISLLVLLLIWGGMWLLGSAAFRALDLHIASLPAVAGAAVAWSGVTWYRQSTEERARRRLQVALTQYTSPAIAAAIADRARPDTLLPRTATVTCFFSDLEGFTRLSEELGPERTRDVLNPYLELTSRILIEHGAIVNKFVGDGVFAFFNAPIRPCEDHARQACRAAQQLIRECPSVRSNKGGTAVDAEHRLRIGLSSGEVFVGDYGSHAKLDYTCIGDTVNLGSRLEQLNKIFGTAVLLDGATHCLAGEEFSLRPLGLIRIHGREAPADVYEIVPDEWCNDPRFAAYSQSWANALAAYQACQWDSCGRALAACRAIKPHDRALNLYAQAVERLRNTGAISDSDGSLTLEEFLPSQREHGK